MCGFPNYELEGKIVSINYIISILVYSIFKQNSFCKFNEKNFAQVNMNVMIRSDLKWSKHILEFIDQSVCEKRLFKHFCEQF